MLSEVGNISTDEYCVIYIFDYTYIGYTIEISEEKNVHKHNNMSIFGFFEVVSLRKADVGNNIQRDIIIIYYIFIRYIIE